MVSRCVFCVYAELALILSVIGTYDDCQVIQYAFCFQRVENLSDVLVHIRDSAVVAVDVAV